MELQNKPKIRVKLPDVRLLWEVFDLYKADSGKEIPKPRTQYLSMFPFNAWWSSVFLVYWEPYWIFGRDNFESRCGCNLTFFEDRIYIPDLIRRVAVSCSPILLWPRWACKAPGPFLRLSYFYSLGLLSNRFLATWLAFATLTLWWLFASLTLILLFCCCSQSLV